MKVNDESSDFSPDTAYSERQVMLYPAAWEDPSPGTMEDIKISIVNDRATGLKRQREELTDVTPCSKRLCSVVFNCSTPSSASLPSRSSPSTSKSKGVKRSHVSIPSYALEQNPEFSDEWDDSLLEPSDNEDDSPLSLTVDEIDSLLEDDSSSVADPSGFDTFIAASESEDEKEKLSTTPTQLHVSNTLTETTLCEEDLNNYATMAPSPSHSIMHPVEDQVSKQKNSIVCNVKSSDSVKKINGMPTSAVPVLDKMEALTQLTSDYTADFPVLSPNSLYTVDVLLEWNEDPELAFDGDIDNLLAISPGRSTSSEEETTTEPYLQCTKQIKSAVSDSTSTFELPNSVPVNQTSDSTGSDTADAVQLSDTADAAQPSDTADAAQPSDTADAAQPSDNADAAQPSDAADAAQPSDAEDAAQPSDAADAVQKLSPSSPYTLNLSEVHCPPSTVPELPEDSGSPSTSTVVISETQTNTDPAEDVIASNSTESDALSTVGLGDQPVNSSATQSASSQQMMTASVTRSSAAPQERSRVAVTPLPRPAHRPFQFCSSDLEYDKNKYCHQVLMHIEGPEGANHLDPMHELASLWNKISRENQNCQHPSNFSRRNHPRSGRKPTTRYTLNEWVEKNGGAVQRFTSIPSAFQRSPLPETLPFQFS